VSVLAVAHRAGNELSRLHAAVAAGADVLEADVHLHAGALEVRHHKALGPLPWRWDRRPVDGRLPLLGDRWDLQPASAFPLRLPALLDATPVGTTVMLDLKGVGRVGPEVARVLHGRTDRQPLLVCARWWPSVDALRGAPGVRPLLSARGRTELARLRRRLAAGPPTYGVSVHRSLLTREVVRGLHDRVERVLTWPVGDLATLDDVLRQGVSGVVTDEPEVLAAVVALR
jgi:glycerophosphoryl diester phosphodiesterase